DDLKRCRQRFSKNCFFIRYSLRHDMQVRQWHGQVLGETAVGVENAHHPAVWTVSPEPLQAHLTPPTGEIDLPNHALADQVRWSVAHLADKLVTRYAVKSHVALEDLQIGGTNPRQTDMDKSSGLSDLRRGVGSSQA